MLQKMAKLC